MSAVGVSGWLEKAYGTPAGRAVARRAGLADPPRLRRGRRRPEGAVVLAEVGSAADAGRGSGAGSRDGIVRRALAEAGVRTPAEALRDAGETPPAYAERIGALVVDATGVRAVGELEELRQVLRPAVRGLEDSGRVIVVGRAASVGEASVEEAVVAEALDGIVRTVGKELRAGATANLVYLEAGAGANELRSTLAFLLDGRSAFVDGQSWHVGPAVGQASGGDEPSERPFEGRVVVVTGAARGIGAAIARTFARDGARVVCVDVPAGGQSLAAVANELRGTALQLDVTAPDAAERLVAHVASLGEGARIGVLVHCAGITRDKMLANLDAARWRSVLAVNLEAQLRINEFLLAHAGEPGTLADDASIVAIASTSGIAGNKGQTNYAASKAGVIGMVRALRGPLAERGLTINAVAPGFIETDMTAKIPFVQREIFRRTNSLQQGGQPVDVAETIAYLADPASAGVTGQVVRVCGQNIVGQ